MSVDSLGPKDRQTALRRRLTWLCHLIRLAALVWIVWLSVFLVRNWSDIDAMKRSWGRQFGIDLSALPATHYAAAFAVLFADLATAALVAVFVWRLFGAYLRQGVFTAQASREMTRFGWVGVAAVLADMAARPLLYAILSLHLENAPHSVLIWADPNDVLHMLMALFVLAWAHIFQAGVEIADEHRQFI